MDIHEIVRKLIGDIEPIGEINTDNARFENLKVTCSLIDDLLLEVSNVEVEFRGQMAFSLKRASEYAEKFLIEARESLED